MSKEPSTPESRAAERDAIAAKYGEVDGAPRGQHLVTDPHDSPSYTGMETNTFARLRQMEQDMAPVQVQAKLNAKAQEHANAVRAALASICISVYARQAPVPEDVAAAKQQLDALVTLAQDWSR